MKKATMNAILSLIATIDTPEAEEIRSELNAELNRGAEQKAQNAELYDSTKSIAFNALASASGPVTLGELYDSIKGELPEGFTKGKLQYAMTRLWIDELNKTEGKVNSYSIKE